MSWAKSEAEIAERIIAWLEDMQWEIYQEVCGGGGRRADILAVFDSRLVWVIETKQTLNFDVIEQAHHWRGYAHYVSVGIPTIQSRGIGNFKEIVLRHFGIGCLTVNNWTEDNIRECVHPSLNRRAPTKKLIASLEPEHKTFAKAGTSGKHWTPFKRTCRDVLGYVQQHPGCTITDVIKEIKTHYGSTSTAKSCLMKFLTDGFIEGVRVDTTQKPFKLYADGRMDRKSPTIGMDSK